MAGCAGVKMDSSMGGASAVLIDESVAFPG